jgi:hypothetical protein
MSGAELVLREWLVMTLNGLDGGEGESSNAADSNRDDQQ